MNEVGLYGSNSNNTSWFSALRKSLINFLFILSITSTLFTFYLYSSYLSNLQREASMDNQVFAELAAANEIKFNYISLELDLRNFLLKDNQKNIPNWNQKIGVIKNESIKLNNFLAGNAAGVQAVSQLNELMSSRLETLNKLYQLKLDNTLLTSDTNAFLHDSQTATDKINTKISNIIESIRIDSDQKNINGDFINGNSLTISTGITLSLGLLLLGFIIVNIELAKREAAEIQSKTSIAQLKSIIEDTSDMIVALDTNKRYILFNHAYHNEFKKLFNRELSIGSNIHDSSSFVPEEKQSQVSLWNQSLENASPTKYVELTVNDQPHVYEVQTSVLKDRHAVVGATHIFRNISDRNREKETLRSSYDTLYRDMMTMKERNEKITLLLEMNDVMLAASELKELSDIIAKYCSKILTFSRGMFYVMHPSKKYLEVGSSWGEPCSHADHFSSDQCWSLRTGHIYDAKIGGAELICEHVKERNPGNFSYLCIPLRAQNDIYGLLYIEVETKESEQLPLSNNDRVLVYALTEVAALALANIRLRDSLLNQSLRDPLTSLYNRRYLNEFLTKQIYQSERAQGSLAVLIIDVDHFKKINDVYGHDAGDLVLKELSQLFLTHVRPGDMAARYGGEEFVIVLYDINEESAVGRAEKLRKEAASMIIKFGAQVTGSLTVSIGLAMYPRDGVSSAQLIESADKALYTAKNSGRNKVVRIPDTINTTTKL